MYQRIDQYDNTIPLTFHIKLVNCNRLLKSFNFYIIKRNVVYNWILINQIFSCFIFFILKAQKKQYNQLQLLT